MSSNVQDHDSRKGIVVLGIFAADLAFRAERMPRLGETLLGQHFSLGAGGKGSNQAVAAARVGASVHLVTRIGDDAFGRLALETWRREGIDTRYVQEMTGESTGAAFIFVSQLTGDNAIIVHGGAANTLSAEDIAAADETLSHAAVFITQLEQPISAMQAGLRAAKRHGVITVLNPAPAPAVDLGDEIYRLCDYITPNESEAEALTGVPILGVDDAFAAAHRLLDRGVGCAVITLGAQGAVLCNSTLSIHMPCFQAGPVADTTGAGDAFNGAFAAALAERMPLADALRFASAVAGISVTRPGTAPAMPTRTEAQTLLQASPS
jgi:ribokinase